MKSTILVVLLLCAAILIGLGLPSAITVLQEQRAEQTEDSGITGVTLTVSSGLSQMEKLAILAEPDCILTNVGVGQHQTPVTLSQHSWNLLKVIMSDYGVPLLTPETTQQTAQFAIMATAGDSPFIYWEVLFTDGDGNSLRLHLDDETGLPLALSYTNADSWIGADLMYEWGAMTLYALNDFCDISLDASIDLRGESETYFLLPITDGVTSCDLLVQLGENRFSVGNQIG